MDWERLNLAGSRPDVDLFHTSEPQKATFLLLELVEVSPPPPLILHVCACVRLFPGVSGAAEHHLQPAPAAGQQGARHGAQRLPVQEK